MNNQLVSIIIPCYNDLEYIEQCIKSAVNQTYGPIEIIVVDDGSNQPTKQKLQQLKGQTNMLITQENKGQSSARNAGIKAANGEIICVLDSDDTLDEDFIFKCFNKLYKQSDVRIVGTYLKLIFEGKECYQLFKPKGGKLNDFLFKNSISGSGILFRKKDAIKIGGYDENMKMGWEDWDFNLRLMFLGGTATVVEEPLYNYLKRTDSTTTRANKNKHYLLKLMYLKHKELYKANFEEFVNHVYLNYLDDNLRYQKIKKSREYKLGFLILEPIRKIKRFLKW
jgi:glycosyltransferase involved in cell wall biosynthesis